MVQTRQFAAPRKTKQWSRATVKRGQLLAAYIEGVAQQKSMARRGLTKVCRIDVFGEEVGRESPANAKVREVVGETITASAIRREDAVCCKPAPEPIREKL